MLLLKTTNLVTFLQVMIRQRVYVVWGGVGVWRQYGLTAAPLYFFLHCPLSAGNGQYIAVQNIGGQQTTITIPQQAFVHGQGTLQTQQLTGVSQVTANPVSSQRLWHLPC